jgi:L-threonylcarbamoyladenylate synthase
MSIISNCTVAALKDAASSLVHGNLVAFPTETVYGLGADATNEKAVARIYKVKGRPTDHPLIVHVSSIELLDKWARDIPEYAIKLARAFWPGPLTLILPKTELAKDFITGGQDNVALRVPSHTLAQTLLKEFEALGGKGIAAPSANRFGAVSPTSAEAVELELTNYLHLSDQILDGGNCDVGIESTIIDCTMKTPRVLRPGAITSEMIEKDTEVLAKDDLVSSFSDQIKAPGLLESHYAPNARVILDNYPNGGDGFIALADIPTPSMAIRLAAPRNVEEFARLMYAALRKADAMKLEKIYVITPVGKGLALAIRDRLQRASKIVIKK